MGFWIFYVVPLCLTIMLGLTGSQFLVHKAKLAGSLLYFLAGVGYLIAAVFAVFYIYATILALSTPTSFTHWSWRMFWNDNIAFAVLTLILLIINIVALRHSKKIQLRIR